MNDIIVAAPDGTELRCMLFSEYDFEVGDEENSFLVTIPRPEWEPVANDSRIYIPGTEYGGLYKRLESDTKNNSVAVGGLTWRGMLQKKIKRAEISTPRITRRFIRRLIISSKNTTRR